MNILLTNDDGIESRGILALESVLSKKHNTYLIAPSRERSATSQALTIFHRMRVKKFAENKYSVEGYPTDCANIGLFGDLFPEIDMIISGINRGVNMGDDVHYSGTVGAARHGAVHKKYSLAVSSVKRDGDWDYIKEAEYISEFIDKKISLLKKGIVYNVNFPLEYSTDIEKMEITSLGQRSYTDRYETAHITETNSHFLLALSHLGYISTPGSDFESFDNGKVTITPITLNTTDRDEYLNLKKVYSGI